MRVNFGSKPVSEVRPGENLAMKRRSIACLMAAVGSTSVLSATWAQAPAISSAPTGAETGTTLAVPSQVPSSSLPAANLLPTAQERALVSLQFEDADVAELVRMIGDQSGLQIIIPGDVSNVKIKYINLTNVEPEVAIQRVAQAGNLQWRKLDKDTFIVARTLPAEPEPAAPIQTDDLPNDPNKIRVPIAGPDWDSLPALVGQQSTPEAYEGPREYRYMRIRNVKPSTIAWWLDPEHHPEPLEFKTSRQSLENYFNKFVGRPAVDPNMQAAMNGNGSYIPNNSYSNPYSPINSAIANGVAGGMGQFSQPYVQGNAQFGNRNNNNNNNNNNRNNNNRRGGQNGNQFGGGGGGGGLFDLTEQGVESIIAVDPQNTLLVYATEEGYNRLNNIVQLLDRPLRQVEIEAQFVQVSATSARAFGIDFSSSNGPFTVNGGAAGPAESGGLSIGFVRNNFRATLNALVNQNRAKIVTAPRVTAINNLTATLQSSFNQPILLTNTTTGIGGQVGQNTNITYITTTTGLTVTPTINNDDTITVVMQPQVSTPQLITLGGQQVPQITQQVVQTVANVKDGDTIVLGGLRQKSTSRGGSRVPVLSRIPIIGGLFRTNSTDENDVDLIIFLTARILRRLEDTDPVPGT
jgi:type II secretory pathway component GspD/PulD (secretin)